MKKTTKKSPSKASHKRARKNLDVKPAKGGTVRGGFYAVEHGAGSGRASLGVDGESTNKGHSPD
jgi:hypothetical protein